MYAKTNLKTINFSILSNKMWHNNYLF